MAPVVHRSGRGDARGGTVVGMRGWWRDFADLVLPAECGGCGRARAVLCPRCRAALCGAAPRRVRPVPEPPGLPVVHAAARYGDEVRAVLLAHKERGVLGLAGPLGTALAGAVRAGLGAACRGASAAGAPGARGVGAGDAAYGGARGDRGAVCGGVRGGPPGTCAGGDAGAVRAGAGPGAQGPAGAGAGVPGEGRAVLLVPVPSARRAVRARGHDPARRIALAAAGELRGTGTPARVLAALRHRRAVLDQSGLDSRQRRDNLAGALAVAAGAERLLRGAGAVVLVDDLMTTGASLAEAARAVRESTGGPVVAAAGSAAPGGRRAGRTPAKAVHGAAHRSGYGAASPAVYSAAMGEGRGERKAKAPEERTDRWPTGPESAGVNGSGEAVRPVLLAAVVAASPESFELNRN